MTSLLPQIKSLQDTPLINLRYAEILLDLAISKLLSMDEFMIGIFEAGGEKGSIIGFDGDDLEDVQLELQYSDSKFILVLNENSDENFACTFKYKIFQNSELYQRIPDKLRAAMEKAANKFKSAKYKGKKMNQKRRIEKTGRT